MPAYVVVNVRIQDPDTYRRYRELVPPSIAAFGGQFLARGGPVTVLEGDWHPERFVLLEFPSRERAEAWYRSPEYAPALALRKEAARADLIIADGI